MKALIVLAIGLFLLGGAVFGGWTLYKEFILGAENAEPPPPPPPPPPAFVRMNPIVVPVIGKDRVTQFVTLHVTIQVDIDAQPRTQANQPRLGDVFLTTLYGALDDRSIMRGNLIDIPALKAKLVDAAGKVIGRSVVQDVLIQVVMQRNL